MREESYKGMQRVSKNEARKAWEKGKDIYFFPCMANTESPWINSYVSGKYYEDSQGYTFDEVCEYFEIYNCVGNLGKYAKFFIGDE